MSRIALAEDPSSCGGNSWTRFRFRRNFRWEGLRFGEIAVWALSGKRHHGDVCRLLSKQDVSKAVGVEIVRTESKDNGCSYMANGTQQEMTAKHVKAMVADKGADKKTQEIAEKFAGGMFNALQAEKPASEQDTSGEVPVFVFRSISTGPRNRCGSTQKSLAIWAMRKAFRALAIRRLSQRTA